jgi:hypothetical protein
LGTSLGVMIVAIASSPYLLRLVPEPDPSSLFLFSDCSRPPCSANALAPLV